MTVLKTVKKISIRNSAFNIIAHVIRVIDLPIVSLYLTLLGFYCFFIYRSLDRSRFSVNIIVVTII